MGFVEDFDRLQTGDTVRVTGEEPTGAGSQSLEEKDYYESLESMRVSFDTSVARSGGTNKFDEPFLTLGSESERLIRPEDDASLVAAKSRSSAIASLFRDGCRPSITFS